MEGGAAPNYSTAEKNGEVSQTVNHFGFKPPPGSRHHVTKLCKNLCIINGAQMGTVRVRRGQRILFLWDMGNGQMSNTSHLRNWAKRND